MKSSDDVEASRCMVNSLKGAIDMTDYTTSETTQEIPYGYCHCGCGEQTGISKRTRTGRGLIKGQPLHYIRGHQSRVDFVERFWSYVNVSSPSSCWEWTGHKSHGYGMLAVNRKKYAAHRVSYEMANGLILDNLQVCHHCDNPSCVNPDHLFLGTNSDNVADCISKGRQTRGSSHPVAKLTEQQVLDIRTKYASGLFLQREIAAEYGITQDNVSYIIHRKTWKHIP